MRTHRKPDLLFVLVIIVGIGVAISSYIQYEHSHANTSESTTLASRQSASKINPDKNQFILVSTPGNTISLVKGDTVSNSLQEP